MDIWENGLPLASQSGHLNVVNCLVKAGDVLPNKLLTDTNEHEMKNMPAYTVI